MKFGIVALGAVFGASSALAAVQPLLVYHTTTAHAEANVSQFSSVKADDARPFYYVPGASQTVTAAATNGPLIASATATSKLDFISAEKLSLSARMDFGLRGFTNPQDPFAFAAANGSVQMTYQFVLTTAYRFSFSNTQTSSSERGTFSAITIRDIAPYNPLFNSFGLGPRPALTGTLAAGRYALDLTSFPNFSLRGAQPTTTNSFSESRFDFVLTPLAAVPEPASWGLCIAGFGILGAAARRRYPRAATI